MTDAYVNVPLTHSYARHDSLSISQPRQIKGHDSVLMCDVTHSCARHDDAFMYTTRLMHMRAKTHSAGIPTFKPRQKALDCGQIK